MATPTPGGSPVLDNAIKTLAQVNLLLGGVPTAIALGAAIVQMLRAAGRSDEEAQAEVRKFNDTVAAAAAFNADWLASHPRE